MHINAKKLKHWRFLHELNTPRRLQKRQSVDVVAGI